VVVMLRSVRADGGAGDVPLTDHGGILVCAFGRAGWRSSVWTITVTAAGEVYVNTPSAAVDWRISRPVPDEAGAGVVRGGDGFPMPAGPEYQVSIGGRVVDGRRRLPAAGDAASEVVTGLSIVVGHEDVQCWPSDATRVGSVRWLDPPPAGSVAMCQVLFLPHFDGQEYVLTDVDAVVGGFGTRSGDAVLVTSHQVAVDDRERAAVASFREWVGRQAGRDAGMDRIQRNGSSRPRVGEHRRVIWPRRTGGGHRQLWDLAVSAGDREGDAATTW
jgi:hypothetical protein